MPQYLNKAVPVTAEQFFTDKPWPKGVYAAKKNEIPLYHGANDFYAEGTPLVNTPSGNPTRIKDGYWIVYDPMGCKAIPHDLFHQHYTLLDDSADLVEKYHAALVVAEGTLAMLKCFCDKPGDNTCNRCRGLLHFRDTLKTKVPA